MFVVEERSRGQYAGQGQCAVYWDGKLVSEKVYLTEDGSVDANDDDILLSLDEIGQIETGNWPKGWGFFMMKDIPNTSFYLTRIDLKGKVMVFEIRGDSYSFRNSKWNFEIFSRKFAETNSDFKVQSMEFGDIYESSMVLEYHHTAEKSEKIAGIFDVFFEKLIQTSQVIELGLSGFYWKQEYEKDERLFCEEVLTPLFRKMHLNDLEFVHGVSEYGKDYVFSERKQFGTVHYSAIQVKAGSLDGKTVGKLSEVLEQIDDAFKIPFEQVNSHEKKYIDTFYLVSSGKITDAAKAKIKSKLKPELVGSVKFIDKNSVLNLVEKFWVKGIVL